MLRYENTISPAFSSHFTMNQTCTTIIYYSELGRFTQIYTVLGVKILHNFDNLQGVNSRLQGQLQF